MHATTVPLPGSCYANEFGQAHRPGKPFLTYLWSHQCIEVFEWCFLTLGHTKRVETKLLFLRALAAYAKVTVIQSLLIEVKFRAGVGVMGYNDAF